MAGQSGGNKKSPSSSDKAFYANYQGEARHKKNKVRKLTKLVKKQPNNKALALRLAAVKKAGVDDLYTRNKGPKGHTWTPYEKEVAQLIASAERIQTPVDRTKKGEMPEWKKVLMSLRSKPKMRYKKRRAFS